MSDREPLRVAAGELDAETILAAMEDGRRVVVRTEMLGSEYEVTLRHDGRTYYCDTPTTLHKHETAEEMRQCLTEQGYVADEDA
jgi:hemin uptake protein HemP